MPIFSIGERRVALRGAHHYVAPGAAVAGSVVLENNVSVWFNVVIRADNDTVRIGEDTNIQDGAVLHCDPGFPLTLGKRVTVGHKAVLHGCTVEDGALIGINAVVLNGARVGAGSLVGANSLVAEGKVIPPGVLAVGTPAKVVRELKPEEIQGILKIAAGYVERSRLFKASLEEQETTR
jgi:carbonic anhydrase/acetyltransferase-like protein (isoleucine patch superfamily)